MENVQRNKLFSDFLAPDHRGIHGMSRMVSLIVFGCFEAFPRLLPVRGTICVFMLLCGVQRFGRSHLLFGSRSNVHSVAPFNSKRTED